MASQDGSVMANLKSNVVSGFRSFLAPRLPPSDKGTGAAPRKEPVKVCTLHGLGVIVELGASRCGHHSLADHDLHVKLSSICTCTKHISVLLAHVTVWMCWLWV